MQKQINSLSFLFLRMLHQKCRGQYYPKTNESIERFPVSDKQVPWKNEWLEYKPTKYTSERIFGQVWADKDLADPTFQPKWNEIDEKVDRRSHIGEYAVQDSYPLNPGGRTGLAGRGLLGRWGPNHAADPIVTRWKKEDGKIIQHKTSNKPVLEMVCIKRSDSEEWAIPGGMIDLGEVVSSTLKREFFEEALSNTTEKTKELESFFGKGVEVYKGYVDDPRNTDNAWMETIAVNFHDVNGLFDTIELKAGDDAVGVKWQEINRDLKLYASHNEFVSKVAKRHDAHW